MPGEGGVKVGSAERRERCPVIVTDGETRPALAATRSLGARGIPVHVVATAPRSLAGVSRFAAAEHVAPDPAREPQAWVAALAGLAAALPAPLILPVTEVATATLLEADPPPGCGVAAPPREAFALAVDKPAFLERAARAGLAVPRQHLVEDPAGSWTLPPDLSLPVVLKARRSRWRAGGAWRAGGVRVVTERAGLRDAAAAPDFAGGMLVQEFVPGRGEGVFLLVERGRTRVRFAHRRIREKPPAGGVSVVSESRELDAPLVARCERLMEELGWHGLAMLEFRRTPEGRAVLMELNPRLWGSVQLAIDAGVDFPALLVDLYRNVPFEAPVARPGVRTRWLLGDVDHLWLALRRREQRRAVGRSVPGACAAFAASFFDGTRLEVWRRDDRRPFWRELSRWLRR